MCACTNISRSHSGQREDAAILQLESVALGFLVLVSFLQSSRLLKIKSSTVLGSACAGRLLACPVMNRKSHLEVKKPAVLVKNYFFNIYLTRPFSVIHIVVSSRLLFCDLR